MISVLFFLFGVGVWSPGLQGISVPPPEYEIAAPSHEWTYTPEISAKAAVVMDMNSAGILFEKNENTELPMASLTKLMTALLIMEEKDIDELVKIPQAAATTEGSTMKLQKDEVIRVRDLLKGLLMNSANDGAVALAIHNAGNIAAFVDKMNARAVSLGLVHTHFQNPHGLDADGHYSSAKDLAFLAKKVLQYPYIREISKTSSGAVTSIDDQFEHPLTNTNELLGTVFPVYGLKTGTTDNAGECLVLFVKKGGKEYIIVILGSQNRYHDARELLWPILSSE